MMKSLPKVAMAEVLQRNIPTDWNVKDRTSCEKTLYLGREDDVAEMMQLKGGKVQNVKRAYESEGATGPSRPAWLIPEAVRSPVSWAWRWCNPKSVWVPPYAGREPLAREVVHKLARKERREIVCEKDRSSPRKQPQVEEDAEALPRHSRRRRKTLSEASPWSTAPSLALWWGNLLICPWVVNDLEM
jgi:hypothetical protein